MGHESAPRRSKHQLELEERGDSFDITKISRKQFCWLSGYTARFKPRWWSSPWWLQVAHIHSGSGSAKRMDDRRAVVLLCPLAHELHVADSHRHRTKVIGNVPYPTIDASHLIWLKRYFDPNFYDEDYLERIWIGSPPRPTKPDDFWIQMLKRHTGLNL